MSVPFVLGKILDIIFDKDSEKAGQALDRLKHFSLILCGVFLIGGLANFGRIYFFNSACKFNSFFKLFVANAFLQLLPLALRIVRDLRSKLYRRMLNQEVGWFDQKGTGELVNRLATDTYLVGNSLSQNLSDGLRSTVMVLAGTGMMVCNPRL